MDLNTATPAEIDTELARLNGIYVDLATKRANNASTAHRLNGERSVYKGNKRVYTMPLDTTLTELALKLANEKILPHEVDKATECIERDAELERRINANHAATEALEVEYARRPWSRFISVADGHVHSGTRCAKGTIRVTTQIGWHPELSGKTEAEAVELLGAMLCTHCFPNAPVEWTVGNKPKVQHCDGSGLPPVHGTVTRRMNVSGVCTACKTLHPLTQHGYVRAHKPKK